MCQMIFSQLRIPEMNANKKKCFLFRCWQIKNTDFFITGFFFVHIYLFVFFFHIEIIFMRYEQKHFIICKPKKENISNYFYFDIICICIVIKIIATSKSKLRYGMADLNCIRREIKTRFFHKNYRSHFNKTE